METYDERVVAGEGDYLFLEVLLDLATQLQIPPPVFCGKMQYKEYGMEKWLIQTTIQGRLNEEGESTMEYTKTYGTGGILWRSACRAPSPAFATSTGLSFHVPQPMG
jgi:hypothetical protein